MVSVLGYVVVGLTCLVFGAIAAAGAYAEATRIPDQP
jgi:hypothetical protein